MNYVIDYLTVWHTGLIGLYVLLAGIAYWLPTIVAAYRRTNMPANYRTPNKGQVAVVNGFFGMTLLGWVIALVMALKTPADPALNGSRA